MVADTVKDAGVDHQVLNALGERIDQLVSLDVSSRGVIATLHALVREKVGKPLCLAAARLLADRVRPGDVVLLATGQPDRPTINPGISESDGPPGAAALARALHRGLDAVPIVLCEDALVPGVGAVMQAADFRIVTPDEAIECVAGKLRSVAAQAADISSVGLGLHSPIHGAAVLGFPIDEAEARARASKIIAAYRPAAVVTIEKGGMNDRGVMFGTRGTEIAAGDVAKIDYLVREAAARGIATIGVGDGGNEIGFGIVEDGIKRLIPYGAQARIEGKGGIAAHTATDVMVAAAISNWGGYGIAACLAGLLGNPDVFHTPAVEERLLGESARASFIDGVTGYVAPSADGLPLPVHQAFVTLMGETVRRAVARMKR